MNNDQLINKKFHILQRNKITKDREKFIYNELANRINNSIQNINLKINSCLEIGFSTSKSFLFVKNKFKVDNYFTSDISNYNLKNNKYNFNILSDHDKWNIKEGKFDLIISNFYLHLTNNIDFLFKNINNSLNKNGFFISTFPNTNCFSEIRKSMLEADEDLYGGFYQRFNKLFTIEKLNQILKKNNFKIPVLEVDNIELRYDKFSSLLKDLRYLGNSYIYEDRKKIFESKNYFKKVEEIYWKNYSANNQLLLSLNVIFVTGWKHDISQQKPLKPGQAKFSLAKTLKKL